MINFDLFDNFVIYILKNKKTIKFLEKLKEARF